MQVFDSLGVVNQVRIRVFIKNKVKQRKEIRAMDVILHDRKFNQRLN